MTRREKLKQELKRKESELKSLRLKLKSETDESEIQWLCDQAADLYEAIGDLKSAIAEIDYLNGEY